MRITFNVDCTPEEARAFMGLPDMTALNEKLTEQLGQQMTAMSPDKLMNMWAPMMNNMTNMTSFWTGQSTKK